MTTSMTRILLALALAALPAAGAAAVYKWVDEDGGVHYSQHPPPADRAPAPETVREPPPPAEDPEKARNRLDFQLQEFEHRREERAEAAAEARQQAAEAERRAENCRRARGNLDKLQRTGRVRYVIEGETRWLSPEERAKLEAEQQQRIEKYCEP